MEHFAILFPDIPGIVKNQVKMCDWGAWDPYLPARLTRIIACLLSRALRRSLVTWTSAVSLLCPGRYADCIGWCRPFATRCSCRRLFITFSITFDRKGRFDEIATSCRNTALVNWLPFNGWQGPIFADWEQGSARRVHSCLNPQFTFPPDWFILYK